jgi:hypothetical protein
MSYAYQKFTAFVTDLGLEKHKLDTDTLQVALCNAAHAPVAGNGVLADLTQIAYTNLSTQVIVTTSWSGGKLVVQDLVLTASGAVAPFQYVVVFNQSAPADELICFFDKGYEVTLTAGETFTCDFNQTDGLFQVA